MLLIGTIVALSNLPRRAAKDRIHDHLHSAATRSRPEAQMVSIAAKSCSVRSALAQLPHMRRRASAGTSRTARQAGSNEPTMQSAKAATRIGTITATCGLNEVSIDTYPDVQWHGTVESISPAGAQEFQLLPAQNTSGNWVKVVQRIPLRVRIDTSDAGMPPLRASMSVEIYVDTDYLATRKNAPMLSHCVLDGLNWASPDNFPSWLGLEYCGFLCKRIDASTLFCGRFLDDNKFRESRHKEGSRFL
jgi:hypothetical protein